MKTQLTVAPMVAVALLTLSGPVLAQENSQAQLYGTPPRVRIVVAFIEPPWGRR